VSEASANREAVSDLARIAVDVAAYDRGPINPVSMARRFLAHWPDSGATQPEIEAEIFKLAIAKGVAVEIDEPGT
jgi:hypothetical protein